MTTTSPKPKKKLPNEFAGAGEIVEDLGTRILVLEENFGSNEKIAKTLLSVSETQKDFDKIFETAMSKLIQNSPTVKNSFQEFIDHGDRASFWRFMKRFGLATTWVVSLVIEAVVFYFLYKGH
jgi:hypothetical protein